MQQKHVPSHQRKKQMPKEQEATSSAEIRERFQAKACSLRDAAEEGTAPEKCLHKETAANKESLS
ncbi:MAG: hypothetical protein IJL88_00375 [Clostridia bacterium]|nr:hypothetical protein [Clostridia bacterium]